MTEKTGTFLVTAADDASAVLRDVTDGQVHTLSSNPGVEVHDVLEATVSPDPPVEVTWQVTEVADRRSIDVVDSDLSPTRHSLDAAADADVGDLVRTERAGTGEIHVLSVPPDETATAAREVLEDPETIARAARLGVVRVEVRRSVDDGVLSVRYLPD